MKIKLHKNVELKKLIAKEETQEDGCYLARMIFELEQPILYKSIGFGKYRLFFGTEAIMYSYYRMYLLAKTKVCNVNSEFIVLSLLDFLHNNDDMFHHVMSVTALVSDENMMSDLLPAIRLSPRTINHMITRHIRGGSNWYKHHNGQEIAHFESVCDALKEWPCLWKPVVENAYAQSRVNINPKPFYTLIDRPFWKEQVLEHLSRASQSRYFFKYQILPKHNSDEVEEFLTFLVSLARHDKGDKYISIAKELNKAAMEFLKNRKLLSRILAPCTSLKWKIEWNLKELARFDVK